jgi:hypothetical protein
MSFHTSLSERYFYSLEFQRNKESRNTVPEDKSAKIQHVTQREFTLPNVTQRYSRYGNVTVTLQKNMLT